MYGNNPTEESENGEKAKKCPKELSGYIKIILAAVCIYAAIIYA